MRTFFRVFVLVLALGLSQAWAFEDFTQLWKKKESVNNTDIESLKKERASRLTELQKIEPIYQFIVDEVKSLLPNLIGAIEGKGAKLNAEEILSLCSEIKKQLLVPSSCQPYIKSQAGKDKEDLIHAMEEREAELNSIRPRYREVKQKVLEISAKIEKAESTK